MTAAITAILFGISTFLFICVVSLVCHACRLRRELDQWRTRGRELTAEVDAWQTEYKEREEQFGIQLANAARDNDRLKKIVKNVSVCIWGGEPPTFSTVSQKESMGLGYIDKTRLADTNEELAS